MNKEQLIADIKAMTVLELADLVKALEEELSLIHISEPTRH